MAKRTVRDEIEASLLEQLAQNGAAMEHYVDLLRDYMSLWDTKKALIADIKQRGVVYKDVSSVGVEMTKSNQSVKDLVSINRQMLMILKELGLSTANAAGGGDGDDRM